MNAEQVEFVLDLFSKGISQRGIQERCKEKFGFTPSFSTLVKMKNLSNPRIQSESIPESETGSSVKQECIFLREENQKLREQLGDALSDAEYWHRSFDEQVSIDLISLSPDQKDFLIMCLRQGMKDRKRRTLAGSIIQKLRLY